MFREIFLLFILTLIVCGNGEKKKDQVLVGKYSIIVDNEVKELQIDENQYLGFNFTGIIKIKYQFNTQVTHKPAILKCGRINEASQIYFNDNLIGTSGLVNPITMIDNWSYNLFYVPKNLIKSNNTILFLIKSNAYYIGFRDSLPEISYLDGVDEDSIIKNIILKYINSNEQNFKTYYIKSQYCIDSIKPQSISVDILKNINNKYIFNIKLKYKNFSRVFIDSMEVKNNDIFLKSPYYYTDYYYSKELGLYQPYGVYLPYNYFNEKSVKYPVIYAFGGGSEVHKTFIQGELPALYDRYIKSEVAKPFILISIQGSMGANFFYNEKTNLNYEKSFIEELIPHVEKKFNIAQNRRAIVGLSKGGMAAFSIGMRYKKLFKKIVSISGTLAVPNGSMLDKNPFYIVENLKNSENIPEIFITAGNSDEYKLNIVAEKFHNLLLFKNIKHKYQQFNGGHHHNEWFTMLPEILKFATDY